MIHDIFPFNHGKITTTVLTQSEFTQCISWTNKPSVCDLTRRYIKLPLFDPILVAENLHFLRQIHLQSIAGDFDITTGYSHPVSILPINKHYHSPILHLQGFAHDFRAPVVQTGAKGCVHVFGILSSECHEKVSNMAISWEIPEGNQGLNGNIDGPYLSPLMSLQYSYPTILTILTICDYTWLCMTMYD